MISRITSKLRNRTGIALYKRTPAQVDRFIVHHGASKTPTTAAEELATLRSYDNYHASKGWGGIGYNLAVGPVTGNVYEARGFNYVGSHATGQNTRSVGVVVLGNDPLTARAKEGLRKAYRLSNSWAGKTLTPSGHRDHANTNCPGPKLYEWVSSSLAVSSEPTTPTKPPVKIEGVPVSGNLVYIDGQPVAAGTAAAFRKLAAAFRKATGYTLRVTSGYRSYAQQKSLYDRWRAGTFHAPSVAPPGTSRHENGRALDLRDSGNSPGVTVAGNVRSNWMRNNSHRYGFIANGYNFREPWHFEYQGNPWKASSTSSGKKPTYTKLYIKDVQRRLIRLGFSVGKAGADGIKGVATDGAIRAFQKKYRLTQDALPGSATLTALKRVEVQKSVRATQDNISGPDTRKRVDAVRKASRWGGGRFPHGVEFAQGVVGTTRDGVWGSNSSKAHDRTVKNIQRALGVTQDSVWGPATDKAVRKVV